MILGVPLSEILWLAVAVVVAGVVTGLLAGLFGIGGGAVVVPVLYEIFRLLGVPEDVRIQLCVGTSIAIIVPTTIRSYLAHREKGLVIPRVIRLWAVPAVLGVTCGAIIAVFAPPSVFKIAFIVIASFIAIKFLFAGDRWNLGPDLPGATEMTVYGFIIGLASSLMGVSGGSLSNIVLTLYGKPIHNAVATSAGLGVPITIVGTLGYILAGLPHQSLLPPFSLGFVSLIGLAVMAPLSSLTAPYGARLAHELSRRTLEIAFAIFLLLVSLRFLVSLI
ncbi:MAG TPA: sulfite exporter TauE/SafE family protein [Xanthobacteraceae bacterium]|nr:sulfite exporter TauE/SafE family protein [Xanthobacteraceae bacterium]